MLSVTYKPLMLSVVKLNVVMLRLVMLGVVAPITTPDTIKNYPLSVRGATLCASTRWCTQESDKKQFRPKIETEMVDGTARSLSLPHYFSL